MARILSQKNLFEYHEIDHLGDIERLCLAFEGINDEALMLRLEKKRKNGRNDYPVRVMWNLLIAMKVFGHKTVASFCRELNRNSQLRRICGLIDFGNKKHLVPPPRVFTGFIKLLVSEQEEVDKIFAEEVETLYQLMPGFGKMLAGDGKYLDSYAKRPSDQDKTTTDNRTENDAKYSIKEYHYVGKDGKKHVKKETHYGFKAHIICDVKTELPVAYYVTPANYDEKKAMSGMLTGFTEQQMEQGESLSLDRGYDAIGIIKQIKGMGIAPLVDIRNCWKDGETSKQYKNTNIVYTYNGQVYYVEDDGKQHKMKYEGYDRSKKCLRYSHKGKIYKIYISYDERVFLPIARDSSKFKRLYRGRTAVERLNGRLDRDYLFEDHCIRGLDKMRLMVSLSMIIMNGMAIAKINRNIGGLRSLVADVGIKAA